MLDFKSYLIESDGQGIAPAKHQEHPEDDAMRSHEHFKHAVSALRAVHHALKTGNSGDTHISPIPHLQLRSYRGDFVRLTSGTRSHFLMNNYIFCSS